MHRIAQRRRRLRLGIERSLYRKADDHDWDKSDENEQEAHQMVEEVMIMTNHLVAKYLLEKFPNRTPLRVQRPPKWSSLAEWRKRFHTILNFSLELKLKEDTEKTHKETIVLKVPFKTWTMIMSSVKHGSNVQELSKLVCDLDLFPQLALANLKQKISQQSSQYICSGETFENVPFPWPHHKKDEPTEKSTSISLSEDNRNCPEASDGNTDGETNPGNAYTVHASDVVSTPSCSSFYQGDQCSVDVSNQRDLSKIFYRHSSLCLDAYCHFTSPIRRYIDIIVHRLVVSGIENKDNSMELDEITTICDRCTFLAQNSRDFDKDAKKLQLAVSLQGSFQFVSAFIEDIEPDALRLFFGTGEFQILNSQSVRIARLGPDKDPQEADGQISLEWTFRFLLLDQEGRAQPRLPISDDEKSKELVKKLESQSEGNYDIDFYYIVKSQDYRTIQSHLLSKVMS